MRDGKSYFLNDPAGLEQILLRDVMEHTGSTAVEKPITPEVVKQAEILNGVGIETAPALRATCGSNEAHRGDDSEVDRARSAAGALAVWTGTLRGVYFGREEPLGCGLGDLEGLRQVLDEIFPRSAAAAEVGRRTNSRTRWRRADGRYVHTEWTATPVTDTTGRRSRLVLVSGVDITERRARDAELQRQRDFANTIHDTIPSYLRRDGPRRHDRRGRDQQGVHAPFRLGGGRAGRTELPRRRRAGGRSRGPHRDRQRRERRSTAGAGIALALSRRHRRGSSPGRRSRSPTSRAASS